MMKCPSFLILWIIPFSISIQGMAQFVERSYQKDYLHSESREKPSSVIPQGCLQTKAPSDAVILFDGKNTDAWEGNFILNDDGTMTAAGNGLKSKESFGDMQLHLEWMIDDSLNTDGQKGGNSGIYIMGRYEVQILDNFVNRTYADGMAGAIYGQYPPLVNASVPQGNWNSYDIIFRAPRYKKNRMKEKAMITVLHNGVVVQNAQVYEGPTLYKKVTSYPKGHPDKAPLFLQYHNDPVKFRNIWVRPNVSAVENNQPEWKTLFVNGEIGKDYDQSGPKKEGENKLFEVTNKGIDVLYSWADSIAPFGLIYPLEEFESYNLEFEYKWGNRKFKPRHLAKRDAGVLIHVKDTMLAWPASVECQIQEFDTGDLWVIKGPQVKVKNQDGTITEIDSREKPNYHQSVKYDMWEVDRWNHVRLEVRGSESAKFFVNGHLVNEIFDIRNADGLPLSKGKIGFQAEGAELKYRNIRIQEID